MFCAFSLPNVPFATAVCHFSTSQRTKVLQTPHVLYIFIATCAFRHSGAQFCDILTSKSASELTCFVHFHLKSAFRHSGVQFLISPLTTWLRTRRFNRPTFGLTRHTNHRENTAFRGFSNISRRRIFFLLTFWLFHLLSTDLTTLLLVFSSAFQLSILSEVSI